MRSKVGRVMYPFVRQQSRWMVQFSAGSRRANEKHGPRQYSQRADSDRRRKRGASASRHEPRPRIAHGARDKKGMDVWKPWNVASPVLCKARRKSDGMRWIALR